MQTLITLPFVIGIAGMTVVAQGVPSAIGGNWEVVEWSAPGVSALGPTEADSWVGKRATFEAALAEFGPGRCTAPTYRQTSAETESYFLAALGIHPSSLGLNTTVVEIIEISCAGSDWAVPGSVLIVAGRNRLLAVWDGVFFGLGRAP